jgi:hypothetical protein
MTAVADDLKDVGDALEIALSRPDVCAGVTGQAERLTAPHAHRLHANHL